MELIFKLFLFHNFKSSPDSNRLTSFPHNDTVLRNFQLSWPWYCPFSCLFPTKKDIRVPQLLRCVPISPSNHRSTITWSAIGHLFHHALRLLLAPTIDRSSSIPSLWITAHAEFSLFRMVTFRARTNTYHFIALYSEEKEQRGLNTQHHCCKLQSFTGLYYLGLWDISVFSLCLHYFFEQQLLLLLCCLQNTTSDGHLPVLSDRVLC
jgi:hypothetical protein